MFVLYHPARFIGQGTTDHNGVARLKRLFNVYALDRHRIVSETGCSERVAIQIYLASDSPISNQANLFSLQLPTRRALELFQEEHERKLGARADCFQSSAVVQARQNLNAPLLARVQVNVIRDGAGRGKYPQFWNGI